jgi:hypothetical protein
MFPPPHSVFSQLENTPTGIEHGGQSHLWSASHSPTFKLRGNLSDHGGDNQSSSEDGSGEEWDNDEEEGGMEGENPNEGYDGCEELCRAVTAAALTANSKGIATVTVMGAGNSGNDALVMPSGSDVGRTSPSQTGVFPGPSTSRGNDNHRACVDDAEDETGSPWHSIDVRTPPTLDAARTALAELKLLLHPSRPSGHGFKATGLTSLLAKRLTWMEYFLRAFVNGKSWSTAALHTAQFIGKGPYMSRKVRQWSKAYILDHENLPLSKCGGTWTKSRIADEDLKEEILTHLQSLGKYVTATAVIDYLKRSDVMQRYRLTKSISTVTAERWMKACGFRWTVGRGGQYVDGHEREDVVFYRQNIFLPSWFALDPKLRKWKLVDGKLVEEDGRREEESGNLRRTVVWFHDESTFYAHDRRKKRWVHVNEKATPQPKGEGASLMVADFVSADYGWLRSVDGKESARVLFRAGKARDGWFTNNEILEHAEAAMAILRKHYPNEDHVFVFDNATTHLKRADDALSARNMPKSCREWGVDTPVKDARGKAVIGPDGKVVMMKVHMSNGFFNGAPQEFYWPEGHESAGKFKGMVQILEERGFEAKKLKLKAQCNKEFKCVPGSTNCCCRRILYNQPDFVHVDSLLETTCKEKGFKVLFLPKFHCELNFIEQCWGYAKRIYRCYPASSKEVDLEANVIKALDSVPLESMQK